MRDSYDLHRQQNWTCCAFRHATGRCIACSLRPDGDRWQAAAAGGDGEIIVTARKRDETAISVPVVLSAVGGQELERLAINNLDGISRVVPQLVIGQGDGSIQGGTITLRGVSSGDANPFADQAVSFNIDGAQVARGSIQRMAQMDIGQIEVLKGPQALFYGKNSPGGIVVIHTADPTDKFEAKLSVGFEFSADEVRGDGYISGPLTDSLGARVAFYGSRMRGWVTNLAPATGITGIERTHLPYDREFGGRLTLKFDSGSPLSARFKLNYNKLKTNGPGENSQFFNCPLGAPQLGGPDDCRADDKVVRASFGPLFKALNPGYRDHPYLTQRQILSSLELKYDLGSSLELAAITSVYDVELRLADNFTLVPTAPVVLASYQTFSDKELAQELRLSSSFDGPLNFMVGAYAQKSRLRNLSDVGLDANAPFSLAPVKLTKLRGKAFSIFGQISWDIFSDFELSAGGRYSHESKRFGVDSDGIPFPTPVTNRKWNNFSPEVTLSYRPSSDLTLFASYKRGFLSGGFNAGQGNPATDLTYDQQIIKGFEGGIKARLAGVKLRANLSAYRYDVTGLQVTTLVGITQTVTNAGKNGLEGFEFDATYKTPIEGFDLRGSVSYNHARYDDFTVACYAGQTIAAGCDKNPIGGVFTAQDLAGSPLARAPDWNLAAGFTFEQPIGSALSVSLSGDARYTSGFFTDTTNKPASRQDGYWLLDATLTLASEEDGWDVALIGRNLTNTYYVLRSVDMPLTGSGTGTAGPGSLADTSGYISRGREVMIRASVRFGG